MGQIRVRRTETEVPINLTLTDSTGPVAGATAVYAIRDGDTPDSWLDFADFTFKTAGWATRQAALTGSATQAGLYTAVPGLDLTLITNLPAATSHLVAEYEVTAPVGATGLVSDLVLIDAFVVDTASLVWDALLSAHTVAASFGATITRMLGHLAGRRRIVRGDPWIEETYEADNGALLDTYELKTFGGVDIDDSGGANPIDTPSIVIAERDEP